MQTISTNATNTNPSPVNLSSEYRPDDMRNLVSSSFCTMEYQVVPEKVSPLTGLCGDSFGGPGGVGVFQHDGKGRRVGRRDHMHIRSNWIDDFVISMPMSAHVKTEQRGKIADLEPGKCVFLSTSKPFSAELAGLDGDESFSLLLIRVSGPVLRERVPQIDFYCGCPIEIGNGAGHMMQKLFGLAISDGPDLSAAQKGRFADMLLSAITNVAAGVCESTIPLAEPKSATSRLRDHAMEYIHANLSNPDLCTDLIAAYCQVTPRYVQTAFSLIETTVEGYIREVRLLRCRECLKHPDLKRKTIIEIAMDWGFNDSAYFSRVYKKRFGVSPTEDRKRLAGNFDFIG